MHILIHDYAGHPFTVQLSRGLAASGHRVTHAYFSADAGPKGQMSHTEDDPDTLTLQPIGADIDYSKTNLFKRRAGDIAYGKRIAQLVTDTDFDIVMSGNTPTETQDLLVRACTRAGVPFVYWCQDFYSIATSRLLREKLPVLGSLVGAWYRFLERRQMQRAAHVLHITEEFCKQTDRWGIGRDKVSVIPNWGVLAEIDVMPRDNAWSRAQDLPDGPRLIYSGTLALKHNPELLHALARGTPEAEVLVVSTGVGADMLRGKAAAGAVGNLRVLPLQPFEDFPQVLGAADVLLAVIERSAGEFSVPSKTLSYLCAGRPIVLAAPRDNLAAQIVAQTGAGTVVDPEDIDGFVAAVGHYVQNPDRAEAAGKAGRAYAETHFELSGIVQRFEDLFTHAIKA